MKSRLRFYKQETPYSCVLACLRMVLSGFGLELTEAELRTLCDCTPLGTEALKAVDAARQLGWTKTVKLTLTSQELDSLIDSGAAPILYVNLLPLDGVRVGHAVVAIGVERERISVYDPLQGERSWPRPTFETAWGMMHNLVILVRD